MTSRSVDHRSFWLLTCSQFLGAFNDNLFKQFILILATTLTAQGLINFSWWPQDPQPIAGAVFSLPFVMFALVGGFIADRFSKRSVIVTMNFIEILVMVTGFAALYYGTIDINTSVILCMVTLFFMGTQSSLFGPSKYGTLPEIVREERLSWANGIIQMTTFTAIILGTALPLIKFLREREEPFAYHTSGYFFVGIAMIGWLLSLGIRKRPPAGPERRFQKSLFLTPVHAIQEIRYLSRDKELILAVLAAAWFSLIGAMALFVINSYGTNVLGLTDAGSSLFFWCAGGIALGSLLVGFISGPRVELGIVPIGIVGMSLGFMVTGWLTPGDWNIQIALLITGVFGGFYSIPLRSLIQQRPKKEEKGRVLGAAELIDWIFILSAAGLYHVFANVWNLDPRAMLVTLGVFTLVGAGLICSFSPSYAVRMVLWLLTHTVYRMKVLHPERVPNHGGALLVSNHVSYADPFLVGSSVPRFVRFLMHRSFMSVPGVGHFSRLMKAIPIAEDDGPRELLKSLQEAAEHVKKGHVACIFAEGSISRTGNLLPFSKGLEHIAKRAGVPIIPVYLDRVWGSIFSYRGGKFFFKRPTRVPYPVTIIFGEPLPPGTPAHEVRQAVQEIGAEALAYRTKKGETLATRFIRVAGRYPFRRCMSDHSDRQLNYFQFKVATLLLRRPLREHLQPDEKHVGVLLPPSIGGALANVTLAICGRTSVNLNFTIGQESFDSAIEQCKLRTIISSRQFLEKINIEPDERYVFLEDILKAQGGAAKARATLQALLPSFVLQNLSGVCKDPHEDATVIFSSGSTGMPKGVCLTHDNILSNARSLAQVFDADKRDCMVGVLPLFHSFGYTATLWFPLLSGFMAAYHPNPMDGAKIAEVIRTHGGTFFVSTPTFYLGYLRRWKKEDIETLRIAASGAEKLKGSLSRAWMERFDRPILEGYGCTELSPAVSINLPDIHDKGVEQVGHKLGTIGHPLPGVAARVVDPDSFKTLDVNEEGLLLIKGPNVMRGYLGREDLTKEVIRDGWYVTGDIARIDNDGFITITDRMSRFSKIGGEMVPHVKVEEAIQASVDELAPCPPDVQEAGACHEIAVTALPDERKGEKLVVLHTPLEIAVQDVLNHLKKADLPNIWMPRSDAFVQVEEIPKLASGKFDLRQIKTIAEEGLGK